MTTKTDRVALQPCQRLLRTGKHKLWRRGSDRITCLWMGVAFSCSRNHTHLLHSAFDGIIQLSAGNRQDNSQFEFEVDNILPLPPATTGGRRYNQPTHWKSACFSVKTLTQKSPFLLGSKVDGTMRYSPGGSEKRLHTSRRLMKVSERAADAWRWKKLRLRWTLLLPRY